MNAPVAQLTTAPDLPNDRYWATVDGEKLPQTILSKALRYRDRLRRDGRIDLFRRSERVYYGQDANGGMANSVAVQFGGEAGELVMVRVNHYRSILQGIIATVVNRRLAYDPRATNNDIESANQVTLAKALLEYYARSLDDEGTRVSTTRASLMFGEAYTAQRWDVMRGRPLALDAAPQPVEGADPAEQPPARVVWEGDIDVQVFTPVEVIHDIDATARELQWAILPYRANVWDLVAHYPEQREEILKLRGSPQQRWPRSAWSAQPFDRPQSTQETDIVTVWWLYHLPCPSLEQGRHAIVVGDVLLHDGPMELERIPLRRIMPEREVAVERGHSPAFDLLALQEAYDAAWDTVLSMIDAYGLQSVLVPKGSDFTPESLGKGLQMLEWTPDPNLTDGGIPRPLQLLDLPKPLMEAIDKLQTLMETLSGINSVVRGDPLPQLKSGAALALVQSLAVAFNANLQQAVVAHDEGVASDRLMILKRYADNKRQVETVGRANRGAMREWSKDDLSTIQRVVIEVGSPLQDQTAGKMEIATQFLQYGLVKRPGKYFEVLTTGRLDDVFMSEKAAEDLIIRENQYLADGSGPVVTNVTDDHVVHIREHTAVLAQQNVRLDKAASERVMQHILEHQQKWLAMDPALALVTGQSVMPPPPAGPPAPTAPPPPKGAGPKANGDLSDGPPDPSKARPLGGPPPDGGPNMPTNPLTGARAPQP